ncbi:hypothetical protein [Streptomyces spiramenti]|uniref:Type II toxin-antitoxin system PemK/MazF family toxin n=1 Tax=Streptomyces spiramenti TaxID=2720606 RepID=A0ABX1AU65_9ACTN|nr:hypothetical protein [Streptomyces spiramenti]NJP69251.1 hypothetical protein [Streptomyces spiramenti]
MDVLWVLVVVVVGGALVGVIVNGVVRGERRGWPGRERRPPGDPAAGDDRGADDGKHG